MAAPHPNASQDSSDTSFDPNNSLLATFAIDTTRRQRFVVPSSSMSSAAGGDDDEAAVSSAASGSAPEPEKPAQRQKKTKGDPRYGARAKNDLVVEKPKDREVQPAQQVK